MNLNDSSTVKEERIFNRADVNAICKFLRMKHPMSVSYKELCSILEPDFNEKSDSVATIIEGFLSKNKKALRRYVSHKGMYLESTKTQVVPKNKKKKKKGKKKAS